MVNFVDFDFHSQRRLIFLKICVSEKLVDLGLASKSKYDHVAKRG